MNILSILSQLIIILENYKPHQSKHLIKLNISNESKVSQYFSKLILFKRCIKKHSE